MLLSCTLVGLVILTQGSVSGLKAIGVSILGITLVAWFLISAPELGLWTGLVQWLPIILLTQTLRSSKSLSLTMLVGLVLGTIGIAVQYLSWSTLEAEMISQVIQRMEQVDQLDEELVERNIQLVRLFVLAIVAMAYLVFVLIVLIARWMQASLAESQGFSQEFRALTLGKPAAVGALGLMVLSFWIEQPWLSSLSFLVVVAFMFQGIAVVHSKLALRKQARMLLVLFYTLLLIFPQVVALTAITGVIDNWLVFRKNSAEPNDENKL
jgi:flagellar biosynthesis protein FlhB